MSRECTRSVERCSFSVQKLQPRMAQRAAFKSISHAIVNASKAPAPNSSITWLRQPLFFTKCDFNQCFFNSGKRNISPSALTAKQQLAALTQLARRCGRQGPSFVCPPRATFCPAAPTVLLLREVLSVVSRVQPSELTGVVYGDRVVESTVAGTRPSMTGELLTCTPAGGQRHVPRCASSQFAAVCSFPPNFVP